MSLPSTIPVPPHIQALADQLMAGAQSRFGHGAWTMNAGDGAGGGDGGQGGDGSGDGAGGDGGSGSGSGDGSGGNDGGGAGQGRELGFPANTPVAEMTEVQQAAYWRNESKKHQGRYDKITSGRSYDDVQADLAELARIRQEQQTPAEKALNERYEQGKKDAASESSVKAATAILRANLQSRFGATGLTGTELDTEINDVLDVIDVRKFIGDDGDIDTDRLASAASRFGAGSSTDQGHGRRRDYGGGSRGGSAGGGKRSGESEADRRFGKQQQK